MNDSYVPAPPFSEDLLADLHGGVLDPETSATLWVLVDDDPDALAFVSKLDNVSHSLRTWDERIAPHEPMPPELAARIHSTLDSEWKQQQAQHDSDSNVISIARSRRRLLMGGAAAAAAVAVVAVLIAVRPTEPNAVITAQPTPTVSENPTPERFLTLIGSKDLGPLEDSLKLAGCLQANGFSQDEPLLGSGEVTVDGNPAVVLLLRGTQPRQITILAVGPECSADKPNTLSVNTIG
ncbi:hypothetical protein R4P64_03420 [Rhodococcus sp. IEGM 1366]|uniref:hypothetical protein n=1 Tax=Rhodococcus sp. IEGM 1366 TaxID=3082223 RepID=UPI002953D03C|nr:hypothetical protein [Rhodococcus sp. IEGM 1366]MDV8065547.1 hypothetical protein [Rhodococcus sp. IEGM 1366]